ncbi:LutC/YkgG family protein [Saccharicrinis aurantiacus]|uniref:LutC/YkgG family protein n=1 Tax=Saccharicrinis aurantiacus TaxID=1849719 RepID=UPI00083889E5|nr:LUD domain-containing protein [Saccharicrinis aurantiacus]
MSNSSREKILSRIKESMEEGRDYAFPLSDFDKHEFPMPEDLLLTFKNELESIGGHVSLCNDSSIIISEIEQLISKKGLETVFCLDSEIKKLAQEKKISLTDVDADFNNMEAAITRCEFLVSRTGSIVISSTHESGRRLNVFPPIHIVIAAKSQLVAFPTDALNLLENRFGRNFPSLVSFITGASRTADIEKTLVMGAHGPKELFVFIDESR